MSRDKISEFQLKIGDVTSPFVVRDEFFPNLEELHPVLQEEVQEKLDAIIERDGVEVLDATIDCFVVINQYMLKLQDAGFDVTEALDRVCDNNLLKTTTSLELVTKWWLEYNNIHGDNSVYVNEEIYEDGMIYCLKDTVTNKVKKPVDHPKVDLVDLVPPRFLSVKKIGDSVSDLVSSVLGGND